MQSDTHLAPLSLALSSSFIGLKGKAGVAAEMSPPCPPPPDFLSLLFLLTNIKKPEQFQKRHSKVKQSCQKQFKIHKLLKTELKR